MSTLPRKTGVTSNRSDRYLGRRAAGSYGRPGKERHAQANRAVRRAVKKELRS